MPLLYLAKRNSDELESEFAAATADPQRTDEAIDVLAWLTANGRAEQAEMLAWTWLSEFRESHGPAESADLARRLLLACPASVQLRADTIQLFGSWLADRPEVAAWLAATGLPEGKVTPQRAFRAFDLALAAASGSRLVERISTRNPDLLTHRLVEVVSADPGAGQVTVRAVGSAAASPRTLDVLAFGDEFLAVEPDDFRVLAKTDPDRLKSLLVDDPGGMLVSIIRAAGGQIDTNQLKDNLADRVLTADEYGKWWSRARAAAKKSPNVRIEGRNPAVLVYDHVGVSPEQETVAALSKTWDPPARVVVVEGYLKANAAGRGQPDAKFLADIAALVDKWMTMPSVSLGDAMAAHRLAELGVPVAPEHAAEATRRLAEDAQVARNVMALDPAFWPMAVALLPAARPADSQDVYLQLLPKAPLESADAIAAALLDAGQSDRLNAAIGAIFDSPVDSIDGLAWLWVGPGIPLAIGGEGAKIPPGNELLDKLLWLAKQAETYARTNQKLAREIRAKVRGALSARGYGRFREHVESLPEELAPLLRRQIRRADGLGLTVPETMLGILDEKYLPVIEASAASRLDVWLQEDRVYVSSDAIAAREKELDHITNVLMPANSRAIAAAAAHGDLSENSEYKFALEERDLLKLRAARMQQELAQARLLTPHDVPTDHVSIYSRVELEPVEGGGPVVVEIVSPWDSDVTNLRFNYKAPMSRQLLGKRVGDTVSLALEGVAAGEFRIARLSVAITHGPKKPPGDASMPG